MKSNKQVALVSLFLAVTAFIARSQTVLWSDNFADSSLGGWGHDHFGEIREVNQQFIVAGSSGRMNTNDVLASTVNGTHFIPPASRLLDQQTLELRVDLIEINQKGVWAGMDFVWLSAIYGYGLLMDQDNIALGKFNLTGSPTAWFFHEHPALKSKQVTMILAFTRAGSELRINVRVLDKENADAVLFDRTVTDTPKADPVLPNRAVIGQIAGPDTAGTPWPLLSGPDGVALIMQWTDRVNATQGPAQATFDNIEVRRYDAPQLTIEPAVIVSWPDLPGNWILESSGNLDGPYSALPLSPSSVVGSRRQLAVPTSDQTRFFRLHP